MRQEDINTLIHQLRDQGFEVNKFADELRRKANRPGSKFTIEQTLEFGAVALHCKLWFTKKHRSDKFSFRCYDASFLHEINLKHKIVGDLDTAELERQMQKIDWENLTYKNTTDAPNERIKLIKEIKQIVETLGQLSYREDTRHLADLLRMRYFPDTVFETPDIRRRSRELQRPDTFRAEHVRVAFQLVSANLYGIEEILMDANFHCNKTHVAEQVSSGKAHIALYSFGKFPEGTLHYKFPFVKKEEKYGNSEDYHPCLIEATLIPNGITDFKKKINGVSIGRLDKKMKKIDWRREYKKVSRWNEPQHWFHSPAIARIIEMLKQIESDRTGKEIALQLKLKYWIGTPLLDSVIKKVRLEQKRFFPKQTFKWFSDPKIVYQNLYATHLSRKLAPQRHHRVRPVAGRKKGL